MSVDIPNDLRVCSQQSKIEKVLHEDFSKGAVFCVVWFDFNTLCAGARSQNDYLEIAARFETVLLSDVPRMSAQMGSEARRFTLLVDVLYDRHVKLIMSAAVPAKELYTSGALAHEFVRTVSRLHEMQSSEFLALQRRQVDTALTLTNPAAQA